MRVKRDIELTDWRAQYLITGIKPHGMGFDIDHREDESDKRLKKLWNKMKPKILSDYIRRNSGKRPWAWWRFDAKEVRQRIGGQGDVKWEKLAYMPRYSFGLPLRKDFVDVELCLLFSDVKMIPLNPEDPPLYESEAAYLDRHGLLTEAEKKKLSEKDFEAVSIK